MENLSDAWNIYEETHFENEYWVLEHDEMGRIGLIEDKDRAIEIAELIEDKREENNEN